MHITLVILMILTNIITSNAPPISPKYIVLPPESKTRLSKSSKTSLLGWCMDEIIVLPPSWASFCKVFTTQKAEALDKAKNKKDKSISLE